MRFAVMLPQSGKLASGDALSEVAQAAEELGFATVSVRDHLIFDGAYISVGMRDAAAPGDDRTMFEALETLTFVAARTRRIGLGTSVLILPNRHPLLLAKQLATLDVLSGGRLVVGFGIGPNRNETSADTTLLGTHRGSLSREYDSFGAIGPRGPRMDEYFDALLRLWSEDEPTIDGAYVRIERAIVFPKPIQQPHPPILVGGRSGPARSRAVRWDAGWMPSQATTGEIAAGLTDLAERRTAVGLPSRPWAIGVNIHSVIADTVDAAVELAAPTLGSHFADRSAFLERTLSGDLATLIDRVLAYRAAGADLIELKPVVPSVAALIDHLRLVSTEVMPAVAPAGATR